ncbi:MAG TPA: ATP synthase F1 subunit delta [Silvibacterium sp.]|jgi:F-type H+-transporting ATPase subunit delta|nr:ATP synthase F1 subunit delta [Silvibacterium sp.]
MSAFAARYARALADAVADAHLNPVDVESQLADFRVAWHESAGLREVLLDPSFPVEEKIAILDKLNVRLGMARQTRNFIAVLIDRDRLHAFDEILAGFRHEMNRRLGISEVQVTTARRLDNAEREAVKAQVADLTKSRIIARFHEDPSLMGGMIVRIGSTVYDGSVRGRLDRLQEQLAAS